MFKDSHTHFHHFVHAIGRRGSGSGRGPGGGRGFGRGGFMGGDGMPGARKFGSADLQLLLLALLAERPAHGYELIRTLEERSGGFYAPSPGMIYPALTFLEEIGHAAMSLEGTRKLYTLTEAGRTELAANRVRADAMLDMLSRIGTRMDGVRDAFAGLSDRDPDAADALHDARHALKAVLMRTRDAGPDEARRIAAILARATDEILRGRS